MADAPTTVTAPADSGQQPGPPIRVTFVTYDAETDGVAILHDGVQVWQESTFDRLDQYLRFVAPTGRPVVIEHTERV